MTETKPNPKPPYLKIGEICRFLIRAFDTKSTDPKLGKKLDELVQEGDFDWSMRQQVIEGLLVEPLQGFDDDLSKFVNEFVASRLDEYIRMLPEIPLDAMSRKDSAPLLLEFSGARCVAAFLILLREKFGGPAINDFLEQNTSPVDVVFQWAENSLGLDVPALAYPNSNCQKQKAKRDSLNRWRNGRELPNITYAIPELKRAIKIDKKTPEQEPERFLFIKWLVTARALAWLDQETEKAGLGSLIGLIPQSPSDEYFMIDIGRELSTANSEAGRRFVKVIDCAYSIITFLKEKKQQGDKEASRRKIDRLKDLIDQHDANEYCGYILNWCEGLWHVLAGCEKEALEFYELASDQALYRAGQNQKLILMEALSLAARLRKKPAMKRLKHRALAMGLFSVASAELPEKPDVMSDWEIEHNAREFGRLFPHDALFQEAEDRSAPPPPVDVINLSDAKKIKPDYSNPDRIVRVPMVGATKRRKPQLLLFTMINEVKVVRKLLKDGADVNALDSQGGSALLIALQSAKDGQGREALDLLLKQQHEAETLNRLTAKKRLSPLYVAVGLGDPEVVSWLVKGRADPDMQASYPPQTPLYHCIERFAFYREGWAKSHSMQRMAYPQPEDSELNRRYTGGLAGVFGDQLPMPNLANPHHAEIMEEVVEYFAQRAAKIPREHYLKIAEILVQNGADPNFKHSMPVSGRTPLMMAAELDDVDAFRILFEAGGDLSMKDDQGSSALLLALDSAEVRSRRQVLDFVLKQPQLVTVRSPISNIPKRGPGRTRLMVAAELDDVDAFRILFEAGGDLSMKDDQGCSALLLALESAAVRSRRQVLDFLLKQPHKEETLNKMIKYEGLSPLYLAVRLGDPEVVSELIKMGADPNKQAGDPLRTLLYYCIELIIHLHRNQELVAKKNYLKIAEILLSHGADPNHKHCHPKWKGVTPLMAVAACNVADAFRILIKAGGDPRKKDDQGHDCYDIADRSESHDVLSILLEQSDGSK